MGLWKAEESRRSQDCGPITPGRRTAEGGCPHMSCNRLRHPSHKPGQSLHQIVVDDHDGEQHQENERRLVDAFFDAQADVAPHEPFDQAETG